jgi:hypothetical protein
MKPISIFTVAGGLLFFSLIAQRSPAPIMEPAVSPLQAGDGKKLTVVDYFLRLPDKTFEGSAAGWLRFLKQPKCGAIDVANGYLNCTGDGAQPSFDLALFRYRDGRPLLALCSGELEGDDSVLLSFFELGADGKMHEAPRKIFPVGDAWSNGGEEPQPQNWYFDLPRQGRTVLVRSLKSKKVLRKFTWNGEKFVEQRDAAPR